ncbi:MAG: UDP-glucose/GDP-mannose dehydrogenase family protein, partial [candidate division WOR-3 bacterium]
VIQKLLEEGAKISCYDPVAIENAKKIFKENEKIEFCFEKFSALKKAEALILMTDWEEFKKVKPKEIKKYLKIVIDTRNIWQKSDFQKENLIYEGLGV